MVRTWHSTSLTGLRLAPLLRELPAHSPHGRPLIGPDHDLVLVVAQLPEELQESLDHVVVDHALSLNQESHSHPRVSVPGHQCGLHVVGHSFP